MNLRNGPDKSNSNRTAKAISAISIAGILIAVAFLSGLLSVIGSETAIAQQNLTATNATATNATATNATGTTIGNQTAAGNQTGTAATTGGNNTAGTTGVY
jgi:hypothetical protein